MIDRRFFGCVAIYAFSAALIQIQLFIPASQLLSLMFTYFRRFSEKIKCVLSVHARALKMGIEETKLTLQLRICI
jgi:hypothetical protein